MPSFNLIKYFGAWEGKEREMGRERRRRNASGWHGGGGKEKRTRVRCRLSFEDCGVARGPWQGTYLPAGGEASSCQSWGDCWGSEGCEAASGSAPGGIQVCGSMWGLAF